MELEAEIESARAAVKAAQARLVEVRAPVEAGADDDQSLKALEAALDAAKDAHDRLESLERKSQALRGASAFAAYASAVSFDGKAGAVSVDDGDPDGVLAVGDRVRNATREGAYKKAFGSFLRGRADLADLKLLNEVKAMREGVDTQGGYLVPADQSDQILMRRAAPTRVLGLVNRLTTSRDRLDLPVLNATGDEYGSDVRIAWHGETGTTTEDTGLENWGIRRIDVHNGSFEIAASKPLIEDADFDLESFVSEKAAEAYQTGVQRAVVQGTGTNEPEGFMVAGNGVTTFNIGNPATAAGLVQFIGDLPEQYADAAVVVANRAWAFQTVGTLTDASGIVGLLDDKQSGLAAPRTFAIAGYPLVGAAQVATAGAGNRVAMFADLRQLYALVERVALTVEPIGPGDRAYRQANAVGWHFRFRVGGRVVQPWAGRIAVQA